MKQEVSKTETNETPSLVLDVGMPVRRDHKDLKFTVPVRKKFFEKLLKEFNISKACAELGVSNTSVYELKDRDEKFRKSLEAVRDWWLDGAEGNGLKVACQPTREGFNDRRFFLESHRPETYGKRQEVNINHQVTIKSAEADIRGLLQEFGTVKTNQEQTEDVDFIELTEGK